MLKELHLEDVGPATRFDAELGTRLNLFTGDNGLGKSFMLDVAWWALTGTWAGDPADPHRRTRGAKPTITYHLIGKTGPTKEAAKSRFDFRSQTWSRPQARPPMPGLVIYLRVDGGFSVWDPARNYWRWSERREVFAPERPQAYHFLPDQLWNGLEEKEQVLCNGLIRDWVNWQNQPEQGPTSPFGMLKEVLSTLSPHAEERMRPGPPTRVWLNDVRDIPTLELPYGNVPVIFASAGMKRVLGLAYLLVWTWREHLSASEVITQAPTDRLILLMDEVESHLHPRWQRTVLPAILRVAEGLKRQQHAKAKLRTQVLATTHAPLVLASVEPQFDEEQDRLFLFQLEEGKVRLTEEAWAKQGDTVGWLTSQVFGLEQARSVEAEQAIEAAEAFMRGDERELPAGLRTRAQIQHRLEKVLPGHDPFWPRWVVATDHGRDQG